MGTSVRTAVGVPLQRGGREQDPRALAAGWARRECERWLIDKGLWCEDLVADLKVGVSEMVTNAIIHTSELRGVNFDLCGEFLRVGVQDSDPDHVPGRPPSPEDPGYLDYLEEGGRGMWLLANLAAEWGVSTWPNRGIKEVWALFNLEGACQSQSAR